MGRKRFRSEYARAQEVAKRLLKPSWVKRYHGGDMDAAARALAEEHGFSGRAGYMRHLCELLEDDPDQAGFEQAVQDYHQEGLSVLGKGGGVNAVTDAQGRYRLRVPSPGLYNVWLKKHDADASKTAAADDGVLVEAGKLAASELRLVAGRKVTGKASDADGKPMAGLTVSCNSVARPQSGGPAIDQNRGRRHLLVLASAGPREFLHDRVRGENRRQPVCRPLRD
jgi:hypothetical protein